MSMLQNGCCVIFKLTFRGAARLHSKNGRDGPCGSDATSLQVPFLRSRNEQMQLLRVATYNIHKARGLDGRVSIKRVSRVLKEIQADIIALQEVINIESLS